MDALRATSLIFKKSTTEPSTTVAEAEAAEDMEQVRVKFEPKIIVFILIFDHLITSIRNYATRLANIFGKLHKKFNYILLSRIMTIKLLIAKMILIHKIPLNSSDQW